MRGHSPQLVFPQVRQGLHPMEIGVDDLQVLEHKQALERAAMGRLLQLTPLLLILH